MTRSTLLEVRARRMVVAGESRGVLEEHGNMQVDRRRDVRVVANGSVLVRGNVGVRGRLWSVSSGTRLHGSDGVRGRLMDVSSGGMSVRLVDGEPCGSCGEYVEIDLHLDRAGATWLQFCGEVVRSSEVEVAIQFTAVPIDFADVIRDALASVLVGTAVAHVLLVDPYAERRAPFAALLRKTGCFVAEAATPLEAIAHLGGSAIHSWAVVITDTVPTSIANDLRRHLAESDVPPVNIVALGERAPTSELLWFATGRAS
jgi:hypothetical protein